MCGRLGMLKNCSWLQIRLYDAICSDAKFIPEPPSLSTAEIARTGSQTAVKPHEFCPANYKTRILPLIGFMWVGRFCEFRQGSKIRVAVLAQDPCGRNFRNRDGQAVAGPTSGVASPTKPVASVTRAVVSLANAVADPKQPLSVWNPVLMLLFLIVSGCSTTNKNGDIASFMRDLFYSTNNSTNNTHADPPTSVNPPRSSGIEAGMQAGAGSQRSGGADATISAMSRPGTRPGPVPEIRAGTQIRPVWSCGAGSAGGCEQAGRVAEELPRSPEAC